LEEKLSKKYKNDYENFSGDRVVMILGLLAWIWFDHLYQNAL
jgi:hypothetical protein